jgi:PRTRC genetic system protein A
MIPSPVAYQFYHGHPLRVPAGKSFVYYLAGNGVFKFAQNDLVKACIPVGYAHVAGLPLLQARIHVKARLPVALLQAMLADARQQSWNAAREAMYHIYLDGERAVIQKPSQCGSSQHLAYQGGGDPRIICDVHSHHAMPAFFSPKDDADEQGFRFYAVMGHIFKRPEVRLRLGMFGDVWPVPLRTLFVGDLSFIPPRADRNVWPRKQQLSIPRHKLRRLYEGDWRDTGADDDRA